MAVCINPLCRQPENPDGTKLCQSCGNVIPDLLLNRFKIVKPLGKGSFGKTYLAEDSHKLNYTCVVKQLIANYENNPKVLELFRREAEQLEKLGENSRIPRLIAYFQENNYLYLVQEYIQGEDLEKELAQQGVWNEEKIRQLLEELLPVLQFIHDNGVVHRDLKPDNIMRCHASKALTRKGDLILIDFGVSKDLSGGVQRTMMGTVTGTPGYASWEQIGFGEAYPASDLFSLGATCVHLLSNEYPHSLFNLYQGYGWTENYHRHVKQSISDNLIQVLDKLLREKYTERYQSAREVMQDLQTSVPPSKFLNQTQVVSPLPVEPETQNPLGLKTFSFTTFRVNSRGREIEIKKQKASYIREKLGKSKGLIAQLLGNEITLDMVKIPGGKFLMGSPKGEGYDNAKYQHQVTVKTFFIGKYPVTQAQWQVVANLAKINRELEPNPARFKGNNRPVEQVSWFDAVEFCERLSNLTGKEYKLPSEAQWEYACRAGTTTPFYFGETITSELANYDATIIYSKEPPGEYRRETTPVGIFPPNTFGLYDMHGNVWEWCEETWHRNDEGAPQESIAWMDEENNNSESRKLLRGGSWNFIPGLCRSAFRLSSYPAVVMYNSVGFRVCCGVPRSIE